MSDTDNASYNSNIVSLRSVEKKYESGQLEVDALKGIDLDISQGEHLAILGPSGSGKSTLLNIIGGIDYASSGDVVVAGQELSQLNERELALFRRKTIGFIFQIFNLLPTFTAAENVALPLELNKLSLSSAQAHAKKLLDQVGLKGRENHLPSQLSVGEQQRVAIARALANNPRLILADEPTGNLDQITGKNVMDILVDINKSQGTTLIIVTHSLEVAKRANRIIQIIDGRIAT